MASSKHHDALCRQIEARTAMGGLPVTRLVSGGLRCDLTATGAAALNDRCTPPTIEVNQSFPSNCMSNAALFDLLDEPGSAR